MVSCSCTKTYPFHLKCFFVLIIFFLHINQLVWRVPKHTTKRGKSSDNLYVSPLVHHSNMFTLGMSDLQPCQWQTEEHILTHICQYMKPQYLLFSNFRTTTLEFSYVGMNK